MAGRSADSARIALEVADGPEGKRTALSAIRSVLGERDGSWSLEPLFENDPAAGSYILFVDATPPLTPQQQFDLSYRLIDAGVIRAEPDLPVPVFDRVRAARQPGLGAAPESRDPKQSPDKLWAHKVIRVPEAWALLKKAGKSRGGGLVVGHPDTGYTEHAVFGANLEALDLLHDRDFIENDAVALDDITKKPVFPFRFSGHGTGTGGTIAGRDSYDVPGVAPDATLLPMRAVVSVVQVFDTDVASAVEACRVAKVDVISMSLGGIGLFGLEKAIDRAVADGIIVLAAAGNNVGFVTRPAAYANCLAISATNHDGTPWSGASFGEKVLSSAPGGLVYKAGWSFEDDVSRTQQLETTNGTSFGVAHTAGAAVLWLAMHGKSELLKKYKTVPLSKVFAHVLSTSGTVQPKGWNETGKKANGSFKLYGAGVLDLVRLLKAPLPDPKIFAPKKKQPRFGAAAALPDNPTIEALAASTDLTPDQVSRRLAAVGIGRTESDLYGREVLYNLVADDGAALRSFVNEGVPAGPALAPPFWQQRVESGASNTLSDKLR